MSVVGFQDFWVVGSRLHVKRDDIDGTAQPWMDLGVIEAANPAFELEKLSLFDADGGRKKLVDEQVASIDETYEINVSNLNLENLSILFMANRPSAFSQSVEEKVIAHTAIAGYLMHIHDDDDDASELFNLQNVLGVTDGGTLTEVTSLDSIDKATRTFVFTGVDLTTELAAGKGFIVHSDGLVNFQNGGTYTVVSSVFSVDTTVVVEQIPYADETGLTGTTRVSHENAGVIYLPSTDWEINSLVRGFIRMVEGGAIVDGSVTVIFEKAAYAGDIQFSPQDIDEEIKGEAMIFWGREKNSRQTVRVARISLTPSGAANFTADDFSNMTLSARVISDIDSDVPAGYVRQIAGDLPSKS